MALTSYGGEKNLATWSPNNQRTGFLDRPSIAPTPQCCCEWCYLPVVKARASEGQGVINSILHTAKPAAAVPIIRRKVDVVSYLAPFFSTPS